MKARVFFPAVVRFLAVFGLTVAVLVQSLTVPPARAQSAMVSSLQCAWDNTLQAIRFEVQFTQPLTERTTLTVTSDHPEILYPHSGGTASIELNPGSGQNVFYASRWDGSLGELLVYPSVDTEITVSVSDGVSSAPCTVLLAQFTPTPVPPTVTSTPAQSTFTIKSLACDNWMYDPGNEDQVWLVTVALTEPVIAPVQVRLSTDRSDIVTWTTVHAAPSDGMALVPQGQSEGALFLNSEFQPVATTITVSATDGTNTFTCKALIPKKVNTPTPVVTPNLTPTATPTLPPPPKLSTMRMQVGSRSGNASSMRICLDRTVRSGRIVFALSSDRPDVFPVPPSIVIVEGSRCASFVVNVGETRAPVLVTVTANLEGHSLMGTTMVRPARPAIYMQTGSRALGQSKVTVCDQIAGGTVALASDRPDLFPVPETLVLPAGHACQSIIVPVGAVDAATPVTVTATFSSGTRTGTTVVRNMGVAPAGATAPAPAGSVAPILTVPAAATETPLPLGTPVL